MARFGVQKTLQNWLCMVKHTYYTHSGAIRLTTSSYVLDINKSWVLRMHGQSLIYQNCLGVRAHGCYFDIEIDGKYTVATLSTFESTHMIFNRGIVIVKYSNRYAENGPRIVLKINSSTFIPVLTPELRYLYSFKAVDYRNYLSMQLSYDLVHFSYSNNYRVDRDVSMIIVKNKTWLQNGAVSSQNILPNIDIYQQMLAKLL